MAFSNNTTLILLHITTSKSSSKCKKLAYLTSKMLPISTIKTRGTNSLATSWLRVLFIAVKLDNYWCNLKVLQLQLVILSSNKVCKGVRHNNYKYTFFIVIHEHHTSKSAPCCTCMLPYPLQWWDHHHIKTTPARSQWWFLYLSFTASILTKVTGNGRRQYKCLRYVPHVLQTDEHHQVGERLDNGFCPLCLFCIHHPQ